EGALERGALRALGELLGETAPVRPREPGRQPLGPVERLAELARADERVDELELARERRLLVEPALEGRAGAVHEAERAVGPPALRARGGDRGRSRPP